MSAVPKAPEGHFNLLYFASASSVTAREWEPLPAPLPLRDLFSTLEARYPGIRSKVLDSCLVTVNLNYVDVPAGGDAAAGADGQVVIQAGDEVAIIPPVSSG